jgi:hypothetical protein
MATDGLIGMNSIDWVDEKLYSSAVTARLMLNPLTDPTVDPKSKRGGCHEKG